MKKLITSFCITTALLMVAPNSVAFEQQGKTQQKNIVNRTSALVKGSLQGGVGIVSLYAAYKLLENCYTIVSTLSKPLKVPGNKSEMTAEEKDAVFSSWVKLGLQRFALAGILIGFHYKCNPLKQSWHEFKEAFN